jgi:hypothetical protein
MFANSLADVDSVLEIDRGAKPRFNSCGSHNADTDVQQGNYMRKRSRDSLPGFVAPVLTAPILNGIHQLNRDYVELLIAEDNERDVDSLPPAVINALRALSPPARAMLANCPFALYSLAIESQDFWRNHQDDAALMAAAEADRAKADSLQHTFFAINALFFAWHIANSQRVAAKVLYSLADTAIDRLIPLPLGELQRIARRGSQLLVPRWPGNSAFWPDLIRFAELGDAQRLTTTQLLGSQLIAADLRTNEMARGLLRPLGRSASAAAIGSVPTGAVSIGSR